jgi:hypothetical protein
MYRNRLVRIFYSIHFILHFIYRIYLWFKLGKDLLAFVFSQIFQRSPTYDAVKRDAKRFKKIPRHLGIILSDRDAENMKKIAQVICWALVIGIHFITLFDANGIQWSLQSNLNIVKVICIFFQFCRNLENEQQQTFFNDTHGESKFFWKGFH